MDRDVEYKVARSFGATIEDDNGLREVYITNRNVHLVEFIPEDKRAEYIASGALIERGRSAQPDSGADFGSD